jgi:signal transduction histidine kinase
MTLRLRLNLWYSGVLLASLLAMGALAYFKFVVEPRREGVTSAELREEEGDFSDILVILAKCGLPALALAVGGGWWMTRKTLEPIAALTRAAERLTEHNLHESLERSGNGDELDRLTEVFNAMTARLDEAFRRVREFTLHASHELKTPLTVMHGEIETALADSALSATERERLASQLDEIQRLAKIVDGLGLLTKAGAGLVRFEREPLCLEELVMESFADAANLARAAAVRVALTGCESAPMFGDRRRLRQVLLNLCDNAVKYNVPGGRVTLELRRSAGEALVIFGNTGPGIDPAALPRVFEPFFRGDPSHSSRIEGCGLGLSIARFIARAHHGDISITSKPGEWTSAELRLPLASS